MYERRRSVAVRGLTVCGAIRQVVYRYRDRRTANPAGLLTPIRGEKWPGRRRKALFVQVREGLGRLVRQVLVCAMRPGRGNG